MTRRKFKYRPPTEKAVKESASSGSGFDNYLRQDMPKYKVKEGENKIRILPATWEGADYFGYQIPVIYSVGVDRCTYIPPSFKDKDDPFAERRQQAVREGDTELADSLKPGHRFLYWVIDRKKESDGPLLFAAAPKLNNDISKQMIDEDDGGVIAIDHPEEGYDVIFHKEGTGIKTNYTGVKISRHSRPISDDEDQMTEWLDYIMENPLPDAVNIYSYEHLVKVLAGEAPKASEDDDEEDIPAEVDGRKSNKKSKKKSSKEGLKELKKDEKDEDDDEDKEEKKSGRRSYGRRRKKGDAPY